MKKTWSEIIKEIKTHNSLKLYGKNGFAEISTNLAKYRSKNFIIKIIM